MGAAKILLLVLSVALAQICQGIPESDFFPPGDLLSMTDSEHLFPDLGLPCGTVNQLLITANGTAALQTESATPEQHINFSPFSVSSSDFNNDLYMFELDSSPEEALVQLLNDSYSLYYPRETVFTAQEVLTITWMLTTGTAPNVTTNHFQLVAGFDTDRIFVLYLYADGMMQWSSVGSEVSLRACDNMWTYELPAGETVLNTNIVTDSNVKEPGKYAFLIKNDSICPAVICSAGCSILTGSCTVEDTCDCDELWEGTNCTEVACHDECEENGDCLVAFECTCNEGWSGDNCTVADCPDGCVNGFCFTPNNCTCDSGWEGENCTVPSCHTKCAVNGHCNFPYECICDEGWSGGNCTVADCPNDCLNGLCFSPNNCTCFDGWAGVSCDEANCSLQGCSNGICETPDMCVCLSGWTGASCDQPICLSGCHPEFGSCTVPGGCVCIDGYEGDLCDLEPPPPSFSEIEIALLSAGLVVFVIIALIVITVIIVAIRCF